MAQDAIIVTGIEQYQEALKKMQTDNPKTKKELQDIIRRAIGEARKNVVEDAKDVLQNDPRHAYKAVRHSVYKQIYGAQINILSGGKRGAATKYERKPTLQQGQRGGNRRKRSSETMRYESYEGKDRSFILRFQNSGTIDRKTRYGDRGHISSRRWFGISTSFQMDAAAGRIAEEIEAMLQQEFHEI